MESYLQLLQKYSINTLFKDSLEDGAKKDQLEMDNNSLISLESLMDNQSSEEYEFKFTQHKRPMQFSINQFLYQKAKSHRNSATNMNLKPNYVWTGVLSSTNKNNRFVTYSSKIFLGGLPYDLNESSLMQIFQPFGEIKVEWPGKEQNSIQPKGYVYIIFESEKHVKSLLQACSMQESNSLQGFYDFSSISNGNYYYEISSKRIKSKKVEVIPWIISDSNYINSNTSLNTNNNSNATKTVFVGALHGKLTAENLAKIMSDLFGEVLYIGIDTDRHKYPIGSGRVTFRRSVDYMKAVSAAFLEIKTPRFTKKIQIDPYLEDSMCNVCNLDRGHIFCRELICFRYFCSKCWIKVHDSNNLHIPLVRNSKSRRLID